MKKLLMIIMALLLVGLALPALAEEFGTLKVMDGGRTLPASTEDELIKEYNLPPVKVWEFYKAQLGDDKQIRFTDRGHLYTIEDLGSRPWRRIAISKAAQDKTEVTVAMLTWKWIIIMLTLRFLAVFVVLLVLYMATNIGTVLIKRMIKEPAKQGA